MCLYGASIHSATIHAPPNTHINPVEPGTVLVYAFCLKVIVNSTLFHSEIVLLWTINDMAALPSYHFNK